ncbi:hypothetical protein [Streptomyces sp. NPDC092307]|uniref:hypothetical protein n=1 Tax=Streptomyces sp. NPDC092307 TaxID=3366013 RepID=UPI00381FF4B2
MTDAVAPYVINDGGQPDNLLVPRGSLGLFRNKNHNSGGDAPLLIIPNGYPVPDISVYGFHVSPNDTGVSSLYANHSGDYHCVIKCDDAELTFEYAGNGYADLASVSRPGGDWDNEAQAVSWVWVGQDEENDPLQPGELRREFEELSAKMSALRRRSDGLERHLGAIQRQIEGSTAEQRAANAKIRALLAKLAGKRCTPSGS